MFAENFKQGLNKRGVHYGWVMVVLTFFTTMISSATISTPQVLIIPMTESFSWKISDVTTSIAIMYVILASMAPFGGAMMLRLGITKVVIISTLFSIVGLFSIFFVHEKWHLIFSIGLCLGVASGILGLGLNATIATRWFTEKRGLVVGILAAAFAAGQLILVPVMAWITTIYDWRMAVIPCLVASLLSGLGFIFLGKSWPYELKLTSYGEKKVFVPPMTSKKSAVFISLSALVEASRHPGFWMLAFSFFICGLTSSGLIGQHFIPFCADNNIGIVAASSYLALMGVFNFLGTTASGWLSDRYNNYRLLAIYYGFRGASLIFLPYSNFDVYALSLWAIFFGLDYIATVPPTVRLSGKFFGTVNGPVVFGWVFSAHQFGSAFAAFGAGITRDSLLSYLPSFILAGVFCFLATIIILVYGQVEKRAVA